MSVWSTDAQRRGHNKGLGNTISARAIKRHGNFLEATTMTPEPRYNPDNDSPDVDGVACHGCNHFILDNSDEESHKHQNWFWCTECYYDLPEVQEGLYDVAVAGDSER